MRPITASRSGWPPAATAPRWAKSRRRNAIGGEKRLECLGEARGHLPVRKVTDPLEAREDGALDDRGSVDALGDGNQGVGITPEDRDGRQRRHLVRAIEEVPVLSPKVDDVADAPREGARSTGNRVVAREGGDLLARECAPGGVQGPRRA